MPSDLALAGPRAAAAQWLAVTVGLSLASTSIGACGGDGSGPAACAGTLDDGIACTLDACDSSAGPTHVPDDARCPPGQLCSARLGCYDPAAACEALPQSAGTKFTLRPLLTALSERLHLAAPRGPARVFVVEQGGRTYPGCRGLPMRVRDVMTRRVRTVKQEERADLAAAVLKLRKFRHLPVLDSDDRVVGMLTPADLLSTAQAGGRARPITVSEVMRRPVETTREDDELDLAISRMRQAGVHALPVVDPADHLMGLLTDVDALTALAGARPRFRPLERVAVDAVMTRDPVTVGPDTSLADAAEALLQGGFRHLPVVDDQGRLVGVLSERDLRTRLGVDVEGFSAATLDALTAPVSEAMTPDPTSARAGTPLAEVLEAFTTERLGSLPVVDDADRLVGILSYVDVLRWLRRG